MKLHSSFFKIVIFCVVFCCFVLPPLFVISAINYEEWSFPFSQTVLFALAVFLFYVCRFTTGDALERMARSKYFIFYKVIFPATFCFCILFSISLLTNGLAMICKMPSPEFKLLLPANALQWLFCLLNLFFAAFYEEVLYRFYLPETALFFAKKLNKKLIFLLIEVIFALIFAFSHFYAGIFAVFNALFAHVVLRLFYKKTGFLHAGIAAHFVYNLVQLFLIQL